MNRALSKQLPDLSLSESRLKDSFQMYWPALEKILQDLSQLHNTLRSKFATILLRRNYAVRAVSEKGKQELVDGIDSITKETRLSEGLSIKFVWTQETSALSVLYPASGPQPDVAVLERLFLQALSGLFPQAPGLVS